MLGETGRERGPTCSLFSFLPPSSEEGVNINRGSTVQPACTLRGARDTQSHLPSQRLALEVRCRPKGKEPSVT